MLDRESRKTGFCVCYLGDFKILDIDSGADVTPVRRKAQALVGYLCVMQRPIARERLAGLLWGDRGAEQGRASLRQAIHDVRTAAGGRELLLIGRDTLAIAEDVTTDVTLITAAAQTGSLSALKEVLLRWRGEFFEEFLSIDPAFDAWLQGQRVAMQDNLFHLIIDAVEKGIAKGEIDDARRIVNFLQQRDATNEVAARLGLKLDHLCGDTTAFHRRYERFRGALKGELDAIPSAETQRLFAELAANKSSESGHITSLPHPAETRVADVPMADGGNSLDLRSDEEQRERPAFFRGRGGTVVATLIGLSLALILAIPIFSRRDVQSHRPPLVAVMPFQNLGTDAGSGYFADGIAREIVDALLRTTQIHVAASGSSFSFRKLGASKAAAALGATHVVIGSVQRDSNRIHVIAQLLDMRNNRTVWSHVYDRTVGETPALQQDIASQISNALDMRLSAGSLADTRNIDPAAYDHYLKGRDIFMRRNAASLEAGAAELEEAVRLAPKFDKAWSTLAGVRFLIASYTYLEDRTDYDPSLVSSAEGAAERALALNANNAEALGIKAMLLPANRLAEIDRLFGRALHVEPNNTQLLNWYGGFLHSVGRLDAAREEWALAYDLDRVTPAVGINLASSLIALGRLEEAEKIIELKGDNWSRGDTFSLGADYPLYRRDWRGLEKYLTFLPDDLEPEDRRYFGLVRDTAAALASDDIGSYALLRARWRQGTWSYDRVPEAVRFLSALNDSDGALQLVDAAVSSRQANDLLGFPLWGELLAPDLDTVRRTPRIPSLFAKWGLFDYWRQTNHWPDFCEGPDPPFDCRATAAALHSTKSPAGDTTGKVSRRT